MAAPLGTDVTATVARRQRQAASTASDPANPSNLVQIPLPWQRNLHQVRDGGPRTGPAARVASGRPHRGCARSSASGSSRMSGSRSSKRVDGGAHLHAGEMHPETHVRPGRERDVWLLFAEDVELVGAVPSGLVAIGRTDMRDHVRAGRESRRPPARHHASRPRDVSVSGDSQRMDSSIACGIRERSSRSVSH